MHALRSVSARLFVAIAFLAAAACRHASPAPVVPAPQAAAAPAAPSPSSDDRVLGEGRRWTKALYDGRTQELWDHFSAKLREVFADKAGLDAFRDKVAQLGVESGVVDERIERANGGAVYVRVARFDHAPMPFQIAFELPGDGSIASFLVRPASAPTSEAPTDKLDYATRTALHLPFDGAWTVAWGGRTLAQNHHAAARDQRFAYDFVVVKDGSTHTGDGTRNSDYYAYGLAIRAPAAGRVVVAVDGIPENVPGQMDAEHSTGNYVVIDHGDGEFSFLAHLVPGSLTVHQGDAVEAGRVLGRCGNSGHSSEPHLHYHLQDSPRFAAGDGLPAPWVDYVADGRPVARGEATRGQVVLAVRPRAPGASGGEGS
jgi:murein DD-endopeptidase MepM/ murein hydrolase activator NlpD